MDRIEQITNETNKFIKKMLVLCIVSIALYIVLMVGSGIQARHLAEYRRQCEQYRTELEELRNREQQLTATVTECRQATVRTDELLHETFNGIDGLRKQINVAKEYCHEMEVLLFNIDNSGGDINNHTDTEGN